jgi:mannose-6-phosphate isomerase-like protein (cupin superfamily)
MGFDLRRAALPAALFVGFGAGLLTGISRRAPSPADAMAPIPVAGVWHYSDLIAKKWQPVIPGVSIVPIARSDRIAFELVQLGKVAKHTHHGSSEYGYVTSGEATGWVGGKAVTLKTGDILYLPPDTPHAFASKAGSPLRMVFVESPPIAKDDMHLVK